MALLVFDASTVLVNLQPKNVVRLQAGFNTSAPLSTCSPKNVVGLKDLVLLLAASHDAKEQNYNKCSTMTMISKSHKEVIKIIMIRGKKTKCLTSRSYFPRFFFVNFVFFPDLSPFFSFARNSVENLQI